MCKVDEIYGIKNTDVLHMIDRLKIYLGGISNCRPQVHDEMSTH